jgi:hypothetical protein
MMRTTLSAVAVLALVFATGCGSATTQVKGAPGPRVDGTWKVVFTPKNYRGDTTRVTWYVKPLCPTDACTVDFRSSGKLSGRFVFDRMTGGYELSRRTFSPCVAARTNKILVNNAYREDRKISFHVADERVEGGRRLATELRGEDASIVAMTKEAVRAKCLSPGREVDKFVAVRVSPVSGATPPTS